MNGLPEDFLAMLRRHWLVIAILAVVGGLLAYGASRFLPNRYTSKTLVLVEEPTVPTDVVKPVVTSNSNARLVSMQEQILSRAGLEPVMQELGLFPQDGNPASRSA